MQNRSPPPTLPPPTLQPQRLRLWHLCRHRPGCVAEVIRGGRTPAPNSFAPERWLAVLDAVRLTPEQEAILDRVQTVALSHLDRVREGNCGARWGGTGGVHQGVVVPGSLTGPQGTLLHPAWCQDRAI